MKDYPGVLLQRGRHFFIERYIDIQRRKEYPRADDFAEYGEMVWERVKDLPRGYCHGDLYDGNTHRSTNGIVYLVDFDTSCEAFPMYDAVLYCNDTDYFTFYGNRRGRTRALLERFLSAYGRENHIDPAERAVWCDMVALYHFQLQATMVEIHGLDCVDDAFFDKQLDWLRRWEGQRSGRGG
jgi:Ser/Thr protein kinase RdoA (MazF antagonist)